MGKPVANYTASGSARILAGLYLEEQFRGTGVMNTTPIILHKKMPPEVSRLWVAVSLNKRSNL